jgi:Polyketide cyclase / dehydrase and lipid transport
MTRWIRRIVASVVALVLVVILIGSLLPQSHIVTSTLRLEQPPDSVWSVVRDLAGYPSWWPYVTEMRPAITDDGAEVWIQIDRSNSALPLEVIESEPPRVFVTRIAGEDLPFGGTWMYELRPDGNGVVVTITERGEVYNPIFRVVSRFFIGHYATMDDYLTALAAHFNETAVPTHADDGG